MSNIELTPEQEEQMREEALANTNPATKGLTDGDPAEFDIFVLFVL